MHNSLTDPSEVSFLPALSVHAPIAKLLFPLAKTGKQRDPSSPALSRILHEVRSCLGYTFPNREHYPS